MALEIAGMDDLIAAASQGPHAQAVKEGRVFHISTVVAGLAVPISTTTAPLMALWNPDNSGVDVIPIDCRMAYVSGTMVGTSFGLFYADQAGSNVATGAVFTAFNNVVPINGNMFNGGATKIRPSSAATNTLTAAGTFFYPFGFSEFAAIATTAIAPAELIHNFNQQLRIPPGVVVYIAAAAASGALLQQSLSWEEQVR